MEMARTGQPEPLKSLAPEVPRSCHKTRLQRGKKMSLPRSRVTLWLSWDIRCVTGPASTARLRPLYLSGKLCLRAINDVYFNRIAGYSMKDGAAVFAVRNALGVDRRVDREATKFQWNQCFPRHPSWCLCRQRLCGVGACLS